MRKLNKKRLGIVIGIPAGIIICYLLGWGLVHIMGGDLSDMNFFMYLMPGFLVMVVIAMVLFILFMLCFTIYVISLSVYNWVYPKQEGKK